MNVAGTGAVEKGRRRRPRRGQNSERPQEGPAAGSGRHILDTRDIGLPNKDARLVNQRRH